MEVDCVCALLGHHRARRYLRCLCVHFIKNVFQRASPHIQFADVVVHRLEVLKISMVRALSDD